MLPRNVQISVDSETCNAILRWTGFDGDDAFDSFQIQIQRKDAEPQCFEFGACAVWGLRRSTRFFSDQKEPATGGGFRHPDVRTYDWVRDGVILRVKTRH